MNSKTNISGKNRLLVILLGFTVALFTLASGYVKTDIAEEKETKEVTQTSDKKSPESQATLSVFDAIPNVLQINLPTFLDILISEIEIVIEEKLEIDQIREKGTTEFFRTLFRRIISPNAP